MNEKQVNSLFQQYGMKKNQIDGKKLRRNPEKNTYKMK